MSNIPLTIKSLIDRDKWVDYRDPIWGDSYNWSWERSTNEVLYPVIHHSVTAQTATPDDIALLHKARGWGGIGYHFVITADGKVWYVGDVGTARANVLDMNEKVIGICLVGDFTKHLPTDDQILSSHDLVKFFIDAPQWPNIKSWDALKGHKDLQATACPGISWEVEGDSMRWRIVNRYPYSPQTPTPPPIVDEPPPTPPADCEKQIAGYKSRITDLTNQLSSKQEEVDLANAEVANQKDKLANVSAECQRVLKLKEAEITALKATIPDMQKLEGQYKGVISDLEGKLRAKEKEVGLRELDIVTLKNQLADCKKGISAWTKFWDKIKALFPKAPQIK
jgi:N-acetylmuramoyl-L-alanine amidase